MLELSGFGNSSAEKYSDWLGILLIIMADGPNLMNNDRPFHADCRTARLYEEHFRTRAARRGNVMLAL